MKNKKRNIMIAAVLLVVCAAVYLNWAYNNRWGAADSAMARAEDAAMEAAEAEYLDAMGGDGTQTPVDANRTVPEYFAAARLTRQQSRDEALTLLETAAASESASQEVIDSAMDSIAVMANYQLQEAQLENVLIAKEFADCVVFLSGDGITVAVPAPAEGLSDAAVARISDTVVAETGCDLTKLKIIEVKDVE